jgi:hypothetical protein
MIIFQSGRFWKQSACRECLAPARTWMQCCIPRQFDFQAGCFDSLWFAVQISVWCKTSPTWFATGMFSLSVNKLVLFFMFFLLMCVLLLTFCSSAGWFSKTRASFHGDCTQFIESYFHCELACNSLLIIFSTTFR